MTSNLHPGADFREFEDDWTECPDCSGDGHDESMCECERIQDICFCATPTPAQCDTCKGHGGWFPDHSAEDQAMYEADRDG